MDKNVSKRGSKNSKCTLHEKKLSEQQIIDQMRPGKVAVNQAIVKYQNVGSYVDRKKTGRPRIITSQEQELMRRIIMRSFITSMKKIRAALLRTVCQVSHVIISKHFSKELY